MKLRILIICTGNSCRSQMAEGFLRSFDNELEVYSAGTKPEKEINLFAVEVMKEKGIDISMQYPKSIDKYLNDKFDYVITVCDNAKETCPVFMGEVKHRLHIGFEDPASARGSREYLLAIYRKTRDEIKEEFSKYYTELNKAEITSTAKV
jgi:arsenate reductase